MKFRKCKDSKDPGEFTRSAAGCISDLAADLDWATCRGCGFDAKTVAAIKASVAALYEAAHELDPVRYAALESEDQTGSTSEAEHD